MIVTVNKRHEGSIYPQNFDVFFCDGSYPEFGQIVDQYGNVRTGITNRTVLKAFVLDSDDQVFDIVEVATEHPELDEVNDLFVKAFERQGWRLDVKNEVVTPIDD